MSWTYPFSGSINLYVPNRIAQGDAQRQTETAQEILKRLEKQPGLILADEVGMGKTFVALAVAASIALSDPEKRPVVIMVPPSLKEKWPKDFQFFCERCLPEPARKKLKDARADNAVQFLKLLDDKPSERNSIIFLTHGAMSPARKLQDRWVKLAMIQRSLFGRHNTQDLRRAMGRFAGDLLRMGWANRDDPWEDLLETDPREWLRKMESKYPELVPEDHDDPVPEAVLQAMEKMDLGPFYDSLKETIPRRESVRIAENLQKARDAINQEISKLWEKCIRSLPFKLPLLILDEAHHLKNPKTQLASLFQNQESKDDAEEISKGPLAGVFERMLFLTATPFQLGHYELCSVLERFDGISWTANRAPEIGQEGFKQNLESIRTKLDSAQDSAGRLDREWGLLKNEELVADEVRYQTVEQWWEKAQSAKSLSALGGQILNSFQQVRSRMKEAEQALRPYVIRHIKPKTLPEPHIGIFRRMTYPGKSILSGDSAEFALGLELSGESLLPFLLAARIAVLNPDDRPVFAEGLASSYEAFLHTRQQREKRGASQEELTGNLTDLDDAVIKEQEISAIADWYLDRLEDSIDRSVSHPKIDATVQKALELWTGGEKVLIFCHYLKTGSKLEIQISKALEAEISRRAAQGLSCSEESAFAELERIGKNFHQPKSVVRRTFDQALAEIIDDQRYRPLSQKRDQILEIVRRYLRTPSFLVRFFPLGEKITEQSARESLQKPDGSGMTLEGLIRNFLDFLCSHCGQNEREKYLEALDKIHSGKHFRTEVADGVVGGLLRRGAELVAEKLAGGIKHKLLPNVRLANGQTSQETRQELMLTFNTPFYPDILISSSVLAEGVDLHLNCRHLIHHDLCWNPSTLEQRTGRVDRIGAKCERCGNPIQVYLPYISQTQDEKMYRVVMDRERWFKVVMGENYSITAKATDKIAERTPFPQQAAEELSLNLSVYSG